MFHAHMTPKGIKIIDKYSDISGVYIQKMVLFTIYKMPKHINNI